MLHLFKNTLIAICLTTVIGCSSDDTATPKKEITKEINNSFKGVVNWKKTFGGSLNEEIKALVIASNGDYVVLGNSGSVDPLIGSNTSGTQDYWVMRLSPDSEILWSKTYGGDNDDRGESIALTQDNGFIITGYSRSASGNVSVNNGSYDHWMAKLDNNGTLQWEKNFGFLGDDRAYIIKQTADGGYFTAGFLDVDSYEGPNKTSTGKKIIAATKKHGVGEFWVHKLDATGTVEWERFYGGSSNDRANDFLILDDGYLIVGTTESNDFDISESKGSYDFWVIKINKQGELQWQKNYGGSGIDSAYSISQTTQGDFLVVGDTRSTDGDIIKVLGNADLWVIKIAPDGKLLQQQSFGGTGFDTAHDIIPLPDGSFVVSGSSRSSDGDVGQNFGGNDIWVLNIDTNLKLNWSTSFGGSNFDFGSGLSQDKKGNIIVIGDTESTDNDSISNNGKKDALIISITP